jgi:glucosyl-3-phosphoglycerate synthase
VRERIVSVVVIPARDEEDRIGGCLEALAAQTVGVDAFEVVLVADACRDRTAELAATVAARLGLWLTVIRGPGAGAGAARRLGMDAAAGRLLRAGRPGGLIACTDADSRVRPDWLARQLAHLEAGARVVAGLVELDRADSAGLPAAVLDRRARDAAARLQAIRSRDAGAEHHHFAGSSIGIDAETYRAIGGIEPLPALEDAALADRVAAHGIPIVRAADVRVTTSARQDGRATRGLAVDLAVSTWLETRRYDAARFEHAELRRLKLAEGVSTTVVIPTKQCADTIAGVISETVAPLRRAGLVDELVVVDARSGDGTAERAQAAGARVIQQDDILAEHGPALGKGDAIWRAIHATDGDLVCFLDGDTRDPDPRHLKGLLGPLLSDRTIKLVKGAFERPLAIGGGAELPNEGGRVTELMARPLLNLHEPRLAGFSQPLAGEFAARRDLLRSIPFPVGYGIEIAVLIDALRSRGLDALAECRLGERRNRHQSLRALGEMAYAVLAAVERRLDPRSPLADQFLRPWADGTSALVPIIERPALASLTATASGGDRQDAPHGLDARVGIGGPSS